MPRWRSEGEQGVEVSLLLKTSRLPAEGWAGFARTTAFHCLPASPLNGRFDPKRSLRRGTFLSKRRCVSRVANVSEENMNGLIYLVGLIVIILFILSFLGLR